MKTPSRHPEPTDQLSEMRHLHVHGRLITMLRLYKNVRRSWSITAVEITLYLLSANPLLVLFYQAQQEVDDEARISFPANGCAPG